MPKREAGGVSEPAGNTTPESAGQQYLSERRRIARGSIRHPEAQFPQADLPRRPRSWLCPHNRSTLRHVWVLQERCRYTFIKLVRGANMSSRQPSTRILMRPDRRREQHTRHTRWPSFHLFGTESPPPV